MYFDFEDYRPDINPVGRAISWREGLLISIIVHLAAIIIVLLWPRMFPYNADAARRMALAAPQPHDPLTFVFMQPRVDTRAPKAPDRAEPSDQDRAAREKERAEKPTNPLPFSRGNSAQRVEAPPPDV